MQSYRRAVLVARALRPSPRPRCAVPRRSSGPPPRPPGGPLAGGPVGGQGGGLPRVVAPAARRTPAEVAASLPLARSERERKEDPFSWFTMLGSRALGVGAIVALIAWLGYRQVGAAVMAPVTHDKCRTFVIAF